MFLAVCLALCPEMIKVTKRPVTRSSVSSPTTSRMHWRSHSVDGSPLIKKTSHELVRQARFRQTEISTSEPAMIGMLLRVNLRLSGKQQKMLSSTGQFLKATKLAAIRVWQQPNLSQSRRLIRKKQRYTKSAPRQNGLIIASGLT